jgi:hypothetical protein
MGHAHHTGRGGAGVGLTFLNLAQQSNLGGGGGNDMDG